MGLDTNLNTPPFYDDFNANDNFYRVLFRPSVAVQTRELNQAQSILQDQVEKFGRHVFRDGSVVEGCALSFDSDYSYCKLQDAYSNGVSLTVSDLMGKRIVNSSNLVSIVVNYADGLVSQSPDLKTIFVKYLNTGTYGNGSPQSAYTANDVLTIQSNTAPYINLGTVSVYTTNDSIGTGYALSTSEGVVFQKGFFVRVEPHTTIVSKYSNQPNGIFVGFKTSEQIITSDIDQSLLDNAADAPGAGAPGAHRLKLTANLVIRYANTTTSNTDNFFSIVDFYDGGPSAIRSDPAYAALGRELARRTYEESGNYIINPFIITSNSSTSNTQQLNVNIDGGLGYIMGYRVEQRGRRSISVSKGIDVNYVNNEIVTATGGNYLLVNEIGGKFNFKNLVNISLRSAYANGVDSAANTSNLIAISAPGSEIGTATIKSIEHDSGTYGDANAVFKLYLTNIKMTSGQSFANVKSVYTSTGGIGFADVTAASDNTVLSDSNFGKLVFKLGRTAIRDLRDVANNNLSTFVYKAQKDITFQTNGTATFSPDAGATGGTETFPYSVGALSSAQKQEDWIAVATATGRSANLTGTIAITAGQTNVTGTSTTFASDFSVGDWILASQSVTPAEEEYRRIVSITNNTFLTVSAAFTYAHAAGNTYAQYIPNGAWFNLHSRSNTTVNITSSTAARIDLNKTYTGTIPATVYFPLQRAAASPRTKTVNKTRYVKIDCSNNAANSVGPWCLGLPDVYNVAGVYVGNSVTGYVETNTDRTSAFELDPGMKDDYYDLSYLRIKPGSGLTLNSVSRVLVKLNHFTHSTATGAGFFDVESYPVDDANTANVSAITTQEIPIFRSPSTTEVVDLRDAIDFRPTAANTAVSTNVIASATINPSTTTTFTVDSFGSYVPRPDTNFSTAFSYYLGRKMKLYIDSQGVVSTSNGVPGSVTPPAEREGSLTIATLTLPPYPTLSQTEARTYSRPDYSINIDIPKNRRFTMRDIGVIDDRVNRLEYYTSLSLLEKTAADLLIVNASGAERFKNGFLVDPFTGFDISDTDNSEFNISIDKNKTEIRPVTRRTYVDMVYSNTLSTNTQLTGEMVTLPYTSNSYINQPFASKARNCVENIIWQWKGNVILDPSSDTTPDVLIGADVIVANPGLANWTSNTIANTWATAWGDWRVTSTGLFGNPNGFTPNTTTSDVATRSSVSEQLRNSTALSSQAVFTDGEFIDDISIQPFVRARLVRFHGVSMKPNTRVYPFFDGVNVSVYCTPTNSSYVATGSINGTLTTDSSGNVYGTFMIPANTFKSGTRLFVLADVTDISASVPTTVCSAQYIASNQLITRHRIRVPEVAQTTTNPPVEEFTDLGGNGSGDGGGGDGGGGGDDPICQSFFINEMPGVISGVHISKIDVFFQAKDDVFGVEMQVREVENGFPTTRIVPFGRKLLQPSEVNISADASAATTFEFDSPLFLSSDKEYCFVVKPVGNCPNYWIWVGELGQPDVASGVPIYDNNSTGVLFTSSTNRVWTPFQTEDIKFNIYRATMSSAVGNVVYTNRDAEYLTVANTMGTFYMGESVYQSNNVVSPNATSTNTSTIVAVGNASANAQTAFSTNTYVYLIGSNTAKVKVVSSVPNTTHIVLTTNAEVNSSNDGMLGVLRGNGNLTAKFDYIDTSNTKVNLIDTTANSTVTFTTGTYLIGGTSGAYANISSIDNITYSVVVPQFGELLPAQAQIAWNMKGYSNSGTQDSAWRRVTLDNESELYDYMRLVYSRSNELNSLSGNKSLQIRGDMYTSNVKVSPIVDNVRSTVLVIENLITTSSNTTGEDTTTGTAISKYISKKVVLADGQDAEDLKVYIAAYQPSGTAVRVFCKLLHNDDPEAFDNKAWTEMTNLSTGIYSSVTDPTDLREFEYGLPSTNATATSAFLNATNSNIVKYTSADGSVYNGYKTFAIKLVLQSDTGPHIVPRVGDLRAIAVQV
jgi:hypothetical protein